MSYYTQHYSQQQSPQQKTIRLLFVVALHAALIFALATAVTEIHKKPEPIIDLKPIDEPTPPPLPVTPPEPTQKVFPNTHVWKLPPVDPTGPEPKTEPSDTGTGEPQIVTASSLTRATIIRAPKPIYPSAAARLEESGTTGMKLLITAEGRVADAQVIQSSGSSRLDDAAIKHVMRNWVFTPCTENGKAVSCEQNMRLKWQLEDAKR